MARSPRIVTVLVALALGAGGALGASATGAASSVTAKHRAAAKASRCAKAGRARPRRCRPSYRMSAKRLRLPARLASTAAPGGATPAASTTSPAGSTTPPPDPVTPPPAPPVASTVGANAFDMGGFVLRLTKTTVPAGSLTVFFTNHDVSDHNLWIEGPDGVPQQISDVIGESASTNRTVPVTAGTWRLFCSLPGHEAMTRDLVVTPSG